MTLWIKKILLSSLLLGCSHFAWAEFYVSLVSESSYDASPALVIRLTDALDPDTDLDNYVRVTPAPANGSRWLSLDGGYSWTLPFVEPNTDYQIEVTGQPKSRSGQPLTNKPLNRGQNNGTSTNRLSNSWSVTTASLAPAASFAQSGQYLSNHAVNALPVTLVNIDEIELDVFRVRDDQLPQFLASSFFNGRLHYGTLSSLKKWAELVHTARYSPTLQRHKRETINLDMSPATQPYDHGVYVAVLRKPGVYEYRYDVTFFTHSDLGMQTRIMGDQVETLVNSISTGAALANVEVTYYWPSSGQKPQLDTTDSLGISRVASNRQPYLIMAQQNQQVSFLHPQHNRLDLSDYANVTTRHQALQAFLYAPRDLYRPGETVSINMLLRDYDGQTIEDIPVKARLTDARGNVLERFTWWAKQSGLYQHQFTLDSNAATGDWTLQLEQGNGVSGEYRFKVEEFLPERLSLTFFDGAPEPYRYLAKRTDTVPINGQYLYGAPAAGNRADGLVTVSAATDLFEDWSEFSFGNPSERINPETATLAAIELSDQGEGELMLPNSWSEIKTPLKFRVSASVYESGGRPVTRSQSILSLPDGALQFVGVQPQFSDRPKADQTVQFKLISVDRTGTAQADTVDIRLVRKTRDYYWYYDDSAGWNWHWRPQAYVAFAEERQLTETGSVIDLPLQWGDYQLEVISRTGTTTVYPFRTQYSWGNSDADSLKPEIIDIIFDQDAYAPGSQATLRYQSASAGPGLLQVESSDGVLFSQAFTAAIGAQSLNLNIDSSWDRHDLYLTLLVLAPADQITQVAPKRALGIAHLPIQRTDSQFEVTLSAPEKVEPNQPVRATLTVANPELAAGKPIWATIALVDMGVLNITRYKRPQPEQFFFAQRRFESIYLDLYGKIIDNLGFKLLQQRFGGDFADSDDALSRGGDQPQSEVQILSFFSVPLELKAGQATVDFDLPAFNGRLKWMAVVWSDATFGSAEVEMTVADRLVTQLAMPRFLAMGDQSQLTLDVHNLSDQAQQLSVELTVEGAISTSFNSTTLTLADKAKRSLVIPVQAVDYSGQGLIQLRVSNGSDLDIRRQWRLGVRAPFPLVTQRVTQVIEPGSDWQPALTLANLLPDTIEAKLTLDDQPAINFQDHLAYLLHYPYGCLEQTISSTYPWLLTDEDLADQLDLGTTFSDRFGQAFSDSLRREQLLNGIERLLNKQQSGGTFGYWHSNSPASMWGTAYAAELLVDAFRLGVSFDKQRLDLTLNALAAMAKGKQTVDIWTDDDNAYHTSYRAYATYVLAKADQANLSDTRRLFEQMKKSGAVQSSLPWMHLAVAFADQGDGQNAQAAAALALSTRRDENRYYADYGSVVRDLALSLTLALEHNFTQGQLAEDLTDALSNRRWLSTQERIALLGLAKAFRADGQNWQAKLIRAGLAQSLDQSTAFNSRISGEQLADLQAIEASESRLYASLTWQGIPTQAPEASSNGIVLTRDFFDLQGQAIDFSQALPSGELIIARIEARSLEQRYPEALLVDLLPAGLELENQNLLNAAVNLDQIVIEGKNVGDYFRNYRVDYEEYRDDRYVAAINLTNWSSTTLFYLARAVTPGTYAWPNSFIEDMYRPEFNALSTTPGLLTVSPAN